MLRRLLLLLLILGLSPALGLAQAGAPVNQTGSMNPNTPFKYGDHAYDNLDWVGKAFVNGATAVVQSFSFNAAFIKLLDWVANLFVLTLKYFWTLVGSILIRNIDFTRADSFLNPLGFQTVSHLYTLFISIGVCMSLSLFFLHIGQSAVGLGKMEVRGRTMIRLMVALTVLLLIPYFTSFMALWTNSLSQLVYQQNMMNMNGALEGISQLSASNFGSSLPVQPTVPATDPNTVDNVHRGILGILDYAYYFAFVGCIIGMMVGSFKIATHDQKGMTIFRGALIGLVCVILAFTITRYIFSAGYSLAGIGTNQINSVQSYNGNSFSIPGPQSTPDLNTSNGSFWGSVKGVFGDTATAEANSGLMLLAVIIKIFVSLYGCWIILKVFFSKVYQLLTLAALFILSPLIAASLAHPSTEGIAHAGLRIIIKNYLYSVVWAIALVFMFILTSINFGFQNLGAQNFETALAMLGGLIFLEKIEGLVGLLVGDGKGPSVEGAMNDFGRFGQTMVTGATAAFGGAAGAITASKGAMGEGFGGHHMAGAIAGGAMGFMAPVLGTATSAKMGASAGIKLAHSMGQMFSGVGQGSNSPNPYSSSGSWAEGGQKNLAGSIDNLSASLQARSTPRKPPSNQGGA